MIRYEEQRGIYIGYEPQLSPSRSLVVHLCRDVAAPGPLEERIKELTGRLKAVTDENHNLQGVVMQAHSKIEKQDGRIATLEGIISKKDAAYTELIRKLEAAQAKPGSDSDMPDSETELKKEVRQLRESLGVVRAVEGELRRQSAEKDSRITAAASIVEQLKQATEQLQEEKKFKEADSARLRKENTELHAQVAEAMRLLNAQEESITRLQKQLRAAAVQPMTMDSPEAQASGSPTLRNVFAMIHGFPLLHSILCNRNAIEACGVLGTQSAEEGADVASGLAKAVLGTLRETGVMGSIVEAGHAPYRVAMLLL
jgi:predicted nuclease with TOPRIM domain